MIRFYLVESHTFMEKINPKIRGRNLTLPPLHPVVIWMAKLEKVKAVYIVCRFDDHDGQIVEYFLLYNSISVCTLQNFSPYLGTACAVVMQEKSNNNRVFSCSPSCGPLLTFYGPKYVCGSSSMAFNGARLRVSQHLERPHVSSALTPPEAHIPRQTRRPLVDGNKLARQNGIRVSLQKALFTSAVRAEIYAVACPPSNFFAAKKGSGFKKLQGGIFLRETQKCKYV